MGRGFWLRALAAVAVAALVPACGGSSSGSVTSAVLSILGGNGTTGSGGNGGSIDIFNDGGGDVLVAPLPKKNPVNTSFNVPPLTPFLGNNPYTVTGTVTMTTVAALTGAGQILRGSSGTAFLGDDGINPATGLWVKSGATLTIPAHYDDDDADLDGNTATGTFEGIYLSVQFGILVDGTLRVGRQDLAAQDDAASPNAAYFNDFSGRNVVVTGTLNGRGSDNPGGVGGDGADLDPSSSTFIVTGLVDLSGGNGDDGGDGGDFSTGVDGIWVTGTVLNRGGNGADGNGGDGGDLHWDLDNNFDSFGIYISGTVDCSGGDANNGDGGDCGEIELDPHEDLGSVVISGTVRAAGGNVLSGDGFGGGSDSLGPDVGYGEILITGTVDLRGGRGSGTGDGGSGGQLDLIIESGTTSLSPQGTQGNVRVAGELLLGGGDGVFGGSAGSLSIGISYDTNNGTGTAPGVNVVEFYVASLDASGGSGASGGDAGDVAISTFELDDANGNWWVGSARVKVPIVARGGRGTAGSGGDGGDAGFLTTVDNFPDFQRVLEGSSIDLRGGDGSTNGGDGGAFVAANRWSLSFGEILTGGGAGGTSFGGDAGPVNIASDHFITISGDVLAQGGPSVDSDGGWGNLINIDSLRVVSVSGLVSSNGASGHSTAFGGSAANIDVTSRGGGSVLGGISASGGTGGTPGLNAEIVVDGILIQQ